jgi:hypothetical protein
VGLLKKTEVLRPEEVRVTVRSKKETEKADMVYVILMEGWDLPKKFKNEVT